MLPNWRPTSPRTANTSARSETSRRRVEIPEMSESAAIHPRPAFRPPHAQRWTPHALGKALAGREVSGMDRHKEMGAAVGFRGIAIKGTDLGADRPVRQAAAQEVDDEGEAKSFRSRCR